MQEQKSKGFFRYPDVNFDVETGQCVISGESFMEDSKAFYSQMQDWFIQFHKEHKDTPITFSIKLSYFNTSSSKMLFELLKTLQDIDADGHEVTVNWYYDAHDEDLEEDIMDLSFDIDLTINQIAE